MYVVFQQCKHEQPKILCLLSYLSNHFCVSRNAAMLDSFLEISVLHILFLIAQCPIALRNQMGSKKIESSSIP